jgi:putative membrane-bound dehydrogenase-like protein
MHLSRNWCAGLVVAMAGVALAQVAPDASIKSFKLADGLECTLFASEPMLVNPCDIEVDAHGRVWVCEGANYRKWANPPLRPQGDRIVVLEDSDGDGQADKSTVFYQGRDIDSALGICVLGNRVIVSCSPNIFLFTDTDGDLKADQKEVLFTGISGFQHDHGAHAFVFGPDGKLYFNIGNEGKQLKLADGSEAIDMAGNVVAVNKKPNPAGRSGPYRQGLVFRMNPPWGKEPKNWELETLGWNFRNNYEVNVDSFGTLWQSDNDDDGNQGVRINYVMEFGNYGYTDEITGAGWQTKRTDLEVDANGRQDKPRQHWYQNSPGVVPNLLGTGNGSPCGICIYEGDLLPEVFRNQMIHCDAGPNVVRAYPVTGDGAGYKASIAPLIIGGDKWFRPSDVATAPDGSLVVSDWYDPGVGGHAMGDNKADSLKGRIFRLTPPGAKYNVPKLDTSSAAGAIEALRSPNMARRYLGWVALNEMGAKAEPELMKLWNDANPRIRARAINLLARIPDKEAQYVNIAVKDQDADIRIVGLRMARQLKMDIIPIVQTLVRDPSAAVRRECAITLRHSTSLAAPDLWAELAMQHDGKDRWYLEALGIGADRNEDNFFDAWHYKARSNLKTPAARDIIWRSRSKRAPALLAKIIADPSATPAQRPRYFRAFDFHSGPEKEEALASLLDANLEMASLAETVTRLKGAKTNGRVKEVVTKVLDSAKGTPAFVDLVEQFDVKDRNEEVLAVAVKNPSQQSAATAVRVLMKNNGVGLIEKALGGPEGEKLAAALGSSPEKAVAEMLAGMVRDDNRSLGARRAAVRAMAKSTSGAQALLGMIRNNVLGAELKSVAASELHLSTDAKVRAAAAELMPLPPTKDGQPLPSIAKLMQMKGDASRGQQVYVSVCIQCHQIGSEGTNFGPALTEIGDKLSREALYTAILYPSAGIEHNYQGHVIKVKGGDELVGIIQSETADEIQLRIAGGIVTPIKKSNILGRREQKESIMPEDLQKGMTVQDLVDLVEFTSNLKKAK